MTKKMNNFWCTNGFFPWIILVWIGVIQLNFIFCLSLNHEGMALLKFRDGVVNDPFGALSSWNNQNGEHNPCSWFGIGCSNGLVISLNLTNLCLEGTLASELHHLLHIKSIVLRNNSFSGTIPEELRNLKELELLDLGYNNLYESIPLESESNITIILLDNNGLSCHISHEAELTSFVDTLPYARHSDHGQDVGQRRMLLDRFNTTTKGFSKQPSSPNTKDHPGQPSTPSKTRNNSRSHDNDVVKHSFEKPSRPQPPPPPPKHIIPIDSIPSPPFIPPQISQPLSPPNPRDSTPPMPRSSNVLLSSPSSKSTSSPSPSASQIKTIGIVVGAMGGFIGLVLISLLLYLLRGNKTRKPTGLSGQLQKAFVTGDDRSDGLSSDKPSFVEGLSNLKRSELVTACEDFSNVIGTSSISTIYKGTLSNGVEIAVISLAITSAKDWSRNLETQFRKKVEILSKVNHKNFVNLIGYCEEEQPFTRLMVFQYAPNGSLFEHLHIKEAEHLDWRMRLRVAMGLAYCLEYMHQLTPPVTHPNLNSSAVSLSEDYAAQLSDFCIWNEVAAPRLQPMTNCVSTLSTTSISLESNVYNFGLVLLEMMTGRIPQSLDNSLDEWVSEYMRGEKSLQELVDPTLHFNTKQLDKLSDIIRKCLHSEENRLIMRDVTVKMKEVTGIDQDKAAPRFSSLWWAELDVRSLNGT